MINELMNMNNNHDLMNDIIIQVLRCTSSNRTTADDFMVVNDILNNIRTSIQYALDVELRMMKNIESHVNNEVDIISDGRDIDDDNNVGNIINGEQKDIESDELQIQRVQHGVTTR